MATLYVVATPLGNLGDLTGRAADVLCRVDTIAAEDTRRSRPLLAHVGGTGRLISFHAHSVGREDLLVALLDEGRDVALVTDAGTPGVSDPGAALVRAAREAGHTIVPIPGPSAVATALSASGLPADRFLFLGFLPRKGAEREHLLTQVAESEWTVVLFESANRLEGTLGDLARVAGGDREAVVARELTKLHEEIRAGTLQELHTYWDGQVPRGECTLVVRGRGPGPRSLVDADALAEARTLALQALAEGQPRSDIARRLAEELGLPRNQVYRLVMDLP